MRPVSAENLAQQHKPASGPEELSSADYERFRRLVYAQSGINLGEHKVQLVRARLGKFVRQGQFKSFGEYYRYVEADSSGQALCELLDAITTNTTHLFREVRHFNRMREILQGWLDDPAWRRQHSTLRIWSAACSSGEEPHSIAMVAYQTLEHQRGVELKILATDLSNRMLGRAKQGLYDTHRVGTVPAELRSRYLHPVRVQGQPMLQLDSRLLRAICFARFNLMQGTFPFKHGFDIVFCRNVMIYFDRPTQEKLVNQIATHIQPGGYLLIGHSESLNGIEHPLSYVEPTIYRK